MNGSHPKLKLIIRAITSAFPYLDDFDQFLLEEFEIVRNTIAATSNTRVVVGRVVLHARTNGWLDRLINSAVQEASGNSDIQELREAVKNQNGDANATNRVADLDNLEKINKEIDLVSKLEREVTKGSPYLDVEKLLGKLRTLSNATCRIEVNSDDGLTFGTGFMISRDCLLTNFHVLESVIKGRTDQSRVDFRFGYKALEDGLAINQGRVTKMVPSGLIAFSSYSASDINGGALPTNAELDLALVRLDVSTLPDLESISLPKKEKTNLNADEPLFILQHPNGAPLKFAMENKSVIEYNQNETRVKYRTNTEGGSSGSPCVDQNFDLVAVHHMGDPNWHKAAEFNQGIPVARVIEFIESANI